jgi:hypothetical protein
LQGRAVVLDVPVLRTAHLDGMVHQPKGMNSNPTLAMPCLQLKLQPRSLQNPPSRLKLLQGEAVLSFAIAGKIGAIEKHVGRPRRILRNRFTAATVMCGTGRAGPWLDR